MPKTFNFNLNSCLWYRVLLSCFIVTFFSCSKEKRSEKAALEMQQFVIDISVYAKKVNPDFIIIPQNGVELAYNNADTAEGLNVPYMEAVDGFGVEELFYNGTLAPDKERLAMLQKFKASKKILVSEYVSNDEHIPDAVNRNQKEGFLCFARVKNNYDYTLIPDSLPNASTVSISNLQMAQNYLYLISSDQFKTKQEMIRAVSKTNYDLIITDLFFNDSLFTGAEIRQLKRKANGAKRLVVSYISIGSAEKYRYYWRGGWGLHHPLWLRKKYDGYKDEFWVKFWKKEWKDIIYGNNDSYMKKMLDAGFDGAYLDNVEGYYFLYYKD
jgi:cysteinyl-tRNA synthetase